MISETEIRGALAALGRELAAIDVRGEICLFGGAAMVLAFQARQATKDVDAIFAPADVIRRLASKVGVERGLAEDWINDGVKGFVSARQSFAPLEMNLPNLAVLVPAPEYLLAMKCMAARIGESTRDMEDAKFLIRHLHLTGAAKTLDIVEEYYPASQIPLKTRYFVDTAFEEIRVETDR